MTFHRLRVRRDALPPQTDALLHGQVVGAVLDLTVYGVRERAVITDLTAEWVQFDSAESPTTEENPA